MGRKYPMSSHLHINHGTKAKMAPKGVEASWGNSSWDFWAMALILTSQHGELNTSEI